MKKGIVLALAFLTLLVAACEGEGKTVKLCGRDFVRAVVFTCGGSRWKRHLADYHYLFEGENLLPFSQETNGYADSSTSTDQRLDADSDEIPKAEPETQPDSQGPSKTSLLKKREAAKLLATSCCSVGCSERDISSLC
ncbi:insulin-like peptide INSL5 [Porphyrio hochstetteri]